MENITYNLTDKQLKDILEGMLKYVKKAKEEMSILSNENLENNNKAVEENFQKSVNEIQDFISVMENKMKEREISLIEDTKKIQKDVNKKKKDIDNNLSEAIILLEEIKTLTPEKGERGEDADENKIIQKVLENLPKYQEEQAEDIKEKLETLKGNDRLDASAIKNLPKYDGIGGVRMLSQMNDADLTGVPTDTQGNYLLGEVPAKYLSVTAKNTTGSTIPVGSVVYITGSQGSMATIALADKDTEATSSKTFGVTSKNVTNNGTVEIITKGKYKFNGLDTSSFTEGTGLWLGDNGGLLQSQPAEPAHTVFIGWLEIKGNNSTIIVDIQNGYELNELHGVEIVSEQDRQLLQYETSTGLWKNKNLIGQPNGIASLDGSGKVPSTQLPSYVDDILEYANLASFPVTGETGKLYLALDTNKLYRWSGSVYVSVSEIAGLTNGQVTFGNSTGSLSQSSNLFWDNVNGRLGVGTNTPIEKLHVSGGQARLPNGSVIAGNGPGIAFDSYPNTGMAANGQNLAFWESGVLALDLSNTNKEFRVPADYKFAFSSATNNNSQSDTSFYRNAAGVLRTAGSFIADGNVGIGTTAPTDRLEVIGNIKSTTINKITLTTPTTGATLTIADGKTLTANNSLTLAGTDSTTMTFPSTSATLARTDAGQTFTGVQTFSNAINESKGADIASATTTDIGAMTGNYANITGTTTITGLGTIQAGTRRIVQFSGALTLTYNATSLILPTGANITTQAGDTAQFMSLGSGNWKCVWYMRANGQPLQTIISDTDGATITFDMNASSKHQVVLGGNRTLAVSNVQVGQCFTLNLKQDGTGTRTVTWWSGISWAGGTAPTLTTAINKTDSFGFMCIASNTYIGYIMAQNC